MQAFVVVCYVISRRVILTQAQGGFEPRVASWNFGGCEEMASIARARQPVVGCCEKRIPSPHLKTTEKIVKVHPLAVVSTRINCHNAQPKCDSECLAIGLFRRQKVKMARVKLMLK